MTKYYLEREPGLEKPQRSERPQQTLFLQLLLSTQGEISVPHYSRQLKPPLSLLKAAQSPSWTFCSLISPPLLSQRGHFWKLFLWTSSPIIWGAAGISRL